jgi:hypothetical protein
MASSFLSACPVEIIHAILCLSHPLDVASLSHTCRLAHQLVNDSDQYLWRHLFLLHFDDPRRSPLLPHRQSPISWKDELMARMHVERAISLHSSICAKHSRRVLDIFVSVAGDALPSSSYGSPPTIPSLNVRWLERLFEQSQILAQSPADTQDAHLLARLRAYCLDFDGQLYNASDKSRRTQSRCFVYDLRNYRRDKKWGPFLQDGGVNWVHVEALMTVVLENVRELPAFSDHIKPPLGLDATRPCSAPAKAGIDILDDWAGVEGSLQPLVSIRLKIF